MDDVHLEESSAPKENAIIPAFAPQRSKSESTAFESTRTSLNEQSFPVDHAQDQSFRTIQNYGSRRRIGSLPDIYKRSERNGERKARAFHRTRESSDNEQRLQPVGSFALTA